MLIDKIAPKGGDTRDGKLRKLILEAETPEQQEQLWRIAQGLQNGWPIIIHKLEDPDKYLRQGGK